MEKNEFIARIRHICWVGYQIAAEQPYTAEPTEEQIKSLLDGVDFALENPNRTPAENHDNWMKHKLEQGWKYGEVKDVRKKTHPDLVPFEELPDIEKRKDTMDNIGHRLAVILWKRMEMSRDG